jgi:hypothetical protein
VRDQVSHPYSKSKLSLILISAEAYVRFSPINHLEVKIITVVGPAECQEEANEDKHSEYMD